jgi:hypothetical protein
MEVFFVVVLAAVLLGIGLGAMVAVRRLLALTDRRSGDE